MSRRTQSHTGVSLQTVVTSEGPAPRLTAPPLPLTGKPVIASCSGKPARKAKGKTANRVSGEDPAKLSSRAAPKKSENSVSEVGFTRLQVYLTKAHVRNALEREAKAAGTSLSQTACAMIERGLRGKIEPDADNRLQTLERRLSDHMRTSSRDLMIIEEMIFSTLKIIMTRFPQDASLDDPTYQAAIDIKLSAILDEVARRIGAQNLVRTAARAESEADISEDGRVSPDPLPVFANDASSCPSALARIDPSQHSPKSAPPSNFEMDV
jgi:hypothetical protein